ncbi:MAG: leucine-rich repeat domain-containing protein [Ruminococcaceae bacterium]|nr:leucine-rich repeat domain-containing protein [Oscillospiraceae bacterium]
MKKRLLFVLLIALVSVLFAITTFASERTTLQYEDANGIVHTVPVVKYDDATASSVATALGKSATMQACFVDNSSYAILKATDGSLTAYPTWYIIEPSGSDTSYVAISEIRYGYVNSKSEKTYEEGAILYIEFPEGMTHLRGNSVFVKTGYETNVTEIVVPSTVIEAQSSCFNSAPSLKKVYIKENSQLTKINGGAFTDSANLTYIQFENTSKITSIDGLSGCNLTGKMDLSKNTGLKSLPNSFISDNKNLTEIALPDSIETIGSNAFEDCTNLRFSSSYLPKSLVSIGTHFMTNCKNINETLIFPEGFTTITDEGFTNASISDATNGTFNLVFLGEPTKLIIDGSNYTGWAKYVNVYFAKYTIDDFNGSVYSFTDKEAGTLGTSTSQSGSLVFDVATNSPTSRTQVSEKHMKFFFCGENGKVQSSYMLTDAGTDITEDRGTFVMDGHIHYTFGTVTCNPGSSCIVCDIIQYAPHEKGALASITYPNGFANYGNVNYACLVCENEYADGMASAIFIPHGYAYKLNGSSEGISAKFEINKEARDLFESVNGCELHYGVIVANKDHFLDGDFIQDGALNTKNQKGIQVEIIDGEYAFFSCLVSGFEGGNYNSLEIVMAGYAYTSVGEEKSSVSYFQKQYTPDADDTTNDMPYSSAITRNEVTLNAVTIVQTKAYHELVESNDE